MVMFLFSFFSSFYNYSFFCFFFVDGTELLREHTHSGNVGGYSFNVTFIAREKPVSDLLKISEQKGNCLTYSYMYR